jgi:hypothetical protein
MNTVYENTTYHQLKPNRIKVEYKDDNVYPLGTFGGRASPSTKLIVRELTS